MAITMTITDVHTSKLTITILKRTISFKVFRSLPTPVNKCTSIDYNDSLVCDTHLLENIENKMDN